MSFRTFLAAATLAAVLAPVVSAVDHNNWRTFPPPVGAVTPINNTGTTTSYLTATDAHFYSGITKEWRSVPISVASFYEHYNAYAVVQDGALIHAFSARTGEIATITTSGGASIASGPTSSSWVTLVVDGGQAWGFSSFRGEWVPLAITSPTPSFVAQRLCALLQDGNTIYGFSAYHGTFVPVAADAQAAIDISSGGEVGTAHSPGVFRAFSVNQNTWGVQAFPTTNTLLSEGTALAFSNDTALGFSALTGTFDTEAIAAPPASVDLDAMVAAFVDGSDAVCWGSGQARFERLPNVTSPAFVLDYHLAMVVEPGRTTPFSSMWSAYGAPINGVFSVATNDAMAWADDGVAGYAYSPLTNAWTPAPAVNLIGSPVVVRAGVLLPHTGGYEAISARYGTWVSLPTTQTGVFSAPTNGSVMLAFDGPTVAHAFDTRINRWMTLQGVGPLTAEVKRHSVLATDNVNAYGFGIPSSRWDAVSLNGASLVNFDLSSSTGIIETTQDMHVYCVTGSLSYEGREPEFSRSMKLGNVMRLHQVAEPGSTLVTLIGTKPGLVDLGPVQGTLFLDPANILAVVLPVSVPANGLLTLEIAVPTLPALIGAQPHLQNIVVPPSGPAWLSTSVTPFLY